MKDVHLFSDKILIESATKSGLGGFYLPSEILTAVVKALNITDQGTYQSVAHIPRAQTTGFFKGQDQMSSSSLQSTPKDPADDVKVIHCSSDSVAGVGLVVPRFVMCGCCL